MAEEKKEEWMTYLAITTVVIAVCATLSTFKGGGYSTKSLMNQQKASDQWAFYQAKSIKGSLSEMQTDNLEIQLAGLRKDKLTQPEKLNEPEKKIEIYKEKQKKYEKEKGNIMDEAKNFENLRDEATKHSGRFGIAVIFLQVSILLSSIAALTKKKFVWYISLIVALFGIFYFLDGFWLFY